MEINDYGKGFQCYNGLLLEEIEKTLSEHKIKPQQITGGNSMENLKIAMKDQYQLPESNEETIIESIKTFLPPVFAKRIAKSIAKSEHQFCKYIELENKQKEVERAEKKRLL